MTLTLDAFNQIHAGKPACILGSGPSILSVDLSLLKHFVTFAVNGSILAYPQSDYFVSDDSDCVNWSYFSHELRESKAKALLYEDKFESIKNIFGKRTVYFRHRTGYNVTDKYEHENPPNRILQCRTSIGSAMHIAHIMGCKPLILVGIDCARLSGKRWFWEFPPYQRPKRLDGRVPDKYRRFRDSDVDLVEILDYWQAQGTEFLKKTVVYNASPLSRVRVFQKIALKQFVSGEACTKTSSS